MEQINPYAVMRSTATYEAYRAYSRETAKAGQPFLFLGLMMTVMTPVFMSVGGSFLHRYGGGWRWGFAALIAVMALGGAFFVIGFLRMAKYRRDHPIPEDWRQIPPARWPARPARRPTHAPRA